MGGFNAAHEAETKLEAVLNNVPSLIAKGTGAAAAAKDNLVALTDKLEETALLPETFLSLDCSSWLPSS